MNRALTAMRVGVRTVVREPLSALTIILILAIGMGLTTVTFSFANGVLLHPLPFKAPDELVCLTKGRMPIGMVQWSSSALEILRSASSLSQIAFLRPRVFNFSDMGTPERVSGAEAPADLFELLGVEPILGAVYSPEERQDEPAIISHRLYQRRFGSDPSILGRVIRIDGHPRNIIGVMPETFDFYRFSEVWIPPTADSGGVSSTELLSVFARRAPGFTLQQVQAELALVANALHQHGLLQDRLQLVAKPLDDERDTANAGAFAVFLLLCSTGVFLIVCANILNIFLARLARRRQEVAMRLVLGGDGSV